MKKLISLVLIIALALSLCIFASATEAAGDTLLIAPNPNAETTAAPAEDAATEEAAPTEDAATEEEAPIEEETTEEVEDVTTAGDVVRVILTVIQLLAAAGLVAVVSLQSGKSGGLGATMSGSAETFMSKNQSASKEAMLVKLTKIAGVVFIVLTLVLNVFQAV